MENGQTNIKLSGRRKILIVEDNELNREILTALLEEDYTVLEAENGEVGLQLLEQHYKDLSLIILDVFMPVCDGFEFLERSHKDELLSTVPVIVATGSNKVEDEVKCLQLGASDFVTKPYNPQVVLSRVQNIIKLRESVSTLSVVEYDSLTGLYTLSAFYHHAQRLLNAESEHRYHIGVLDLQEFMLVNSIFGEKMGDRVLQYIASCLKNNKSAIYARQGDKFFSFWREDRPFDREQNEKQIAAMIANAPVPKLIAKLGVYQNVDKTVPISMLCDCAVMAADSIKQNFSEVIAFYDERLQNKALEEHDMEARFDAALENGEFVAWYQPKVDTNTEKVVAAEALVRWIPKNGKVVSPGAFIPLFEKDGLITRLDEYMFETVCRFQMNRISEKKSVVPISINLSRNSIYRTDTVERYTQIADEIGVPKSVIPIELTESASSEGAEVRTLTDRLSAAGFALHMDDFGTGYSSFSSLTSMPFDVIKLDKSLIDRIGNSKGNTVLRHMVNIAQEMGMKTVAEGVEQRAQVDFLKDIGCDMIQGYYFSPPRDQRMFSDMLDHLDESITLDLDTEYRRINISTQAEFDLDEKSMVMLEHVADGMMEGFFIYRATSDETLLYANSATLRIFGCDSMDEFRKLTGNSFKGIVHPAEYDHVEKSIFSQVNRNEKDNDAVEYHIIRRDGSIGHVKDEGHCVHTDIYGNIFYVFIMEDGED